MSLGDFLVDSYEDRTASLDNQKKEHTAEDNQLIKAVRSRLRNGMDCRILVTGESGVGKSAFALRIAEILNPELYVSDIEKAVEVGVSFKALDFLRSTDLPNGSVLDFDEPGQGWFHRNFMSEASKMLAQTFIGMRFQQHVTVLTIPNVSLLDIDAVRLLSYHVHIEAHGRAVVYRMMDQRFGGDPWRKTENDRMTYDMPDTKLWHRYEKRKFEFQRALYAKFRKELEAGEAPQLTNHEISDVILQDSKSFMRKDNPDAIDYAKIQDIFGVGINRAYAIKSTVARKIAEKNNLIAAPKQ